MRRWTSVWAIAIAVVLVTGCGGDSAPEPTEAPPASESVAAPLNPELAVTAATIVDRLGPDEGFAAAVEALDQGYSVDQIMNGADTIEPNGSVPGVGPAGAPLDVVAWSGDASGETIYLAAETLAAAPNPSAEELQAALNRHFEPTAALTDGPTQDDIELAEKEAAEALITGILGLVDVGYTLDQIIEGVFFGEQRWSIGRVDNEGQGGRDRFICSVLASDDGTLVVPRHPAPAYAYESKACRRAIDSGTVHFTVDGALIDTESAATSTSSVAADEGPATDDPSDDSIDGTYVGNVAITDAGGHAAIHENHVTIFVAEGVATVEIDMVFEATWVIGEDDEPCTTVDRLALEGSGSAEPEFYVDLTSRTVERISARGCDISGSEDDDETAPFTGSFSGNTFTGEFLSGVFRVVAERR